jgi:protein TonB
MGGIMLEDSLFESLGRKKTRKPFTVFLSTLIHAAVVALLAAIPLAQTQATPVIPMTTLLLPLQVEASQPAEVQTRPFIQEQIIPEAGAVIAPSLIPPDIAYVIEAPAANAGVLPPVETERNANSILRELVGRHPEPAAPPLPPPPPPPVVKPEPLRVGGNAQLAKLITRVEPEYPSLARQVRVSGVVLLEAVITREGTISNVRVISGHPLLERAARDAVSKWVYQPTLLNGEPIEVVTTITVTFSLQ